MNYQISQPNSDINEAVIEKTGHVITFKMNDVYNHRRQLDSARKEIEAKRQYEDARVQNVANFHKKVAKLDPETLFAAHMYYEATNMVKICDEKLKEIDDQIAEYDEEVNEIKKQIPELDVKTIVEQAEEVLNAGE